MNNLPEDTLLEDPEMEAAPAIPEGTMAAVSMWDIQRAADSLASEVKVEGYAPTDAGAAQAAHVANLAVSGAITPEAVKQSHATSSGFAVEVEKNARAFEAFVQRATDNSLITDPGTSLLQRTEAMGRLHQNQYGTGPDYPVKAFHHSVGAMAFNELNHFSAGEYAPGSFDGVVAQLEADMDAIPVSVGGPVTAGEYVDALNAAYAAAEGPATPARTTESLSAMQNRISAMLDEATSPEDILMAMQMGAAEHQDRWKVWSGSFASTLIPGNDQVHMNKVYSIMRKHGVVEDGSVNTEGLISFFAAGGLAQRELTNRIRIMPMAQQKAIFKDLMGLYDAGYGADVYIADMLQRIAYEQPNAWLDAFLTIAPVASLPGDLALLVKAGKAPKNLAAAFSRQPPTPIVDKAIKHGPQGATEAVKAAASGNKAAQDMLGMSQGDAALHLTPGGFDFTDAGWNSFRGVIHSTTEAASRYMNESRRALGDYAQELVGKSEVMGRLASYAKATGKASLAVSSSRVYEAPDGAISYVAVYKATDGRGFASFEEAKAARKALKSEGTTTTYAYERADGTTGKLPVPPPGLSPEKKAALMAPYKEAKADPLTRWSIIHHGSVTPLGPLAPMSVDVAPLLNPKATIAHEWLDDLSTASPELHTELIRVSGRVARLKNLMEQMWVGKNNLLGFEKWKNANHFRALSANESKALVTGFKTAEDWEDAVLAAGGTNTSVPLRVLENIPGWSDASTKAFIEYAQKGQVMWDAANAALRKRMLLDEFATFRHIDSGKRVVAKPLRYVEWLDELRAGAATHKWGVGLDGKTIKITAEMGMTASREGSLVRLHAPYFSASNKYITHQLIDPKVMAKEMVPAVVLPQRAFWAPRVHTGNWVVVGITDAGDKVAVGMAQSSKWALEGVAKMKADSRMVEKFSGGFVTREVVELSSTKGRNQGYDVVEGQLHGLVFGARNDELAYFGDDIDIATAEPVTAMFQAINKLALTDKLSEVAALRYRLTKGAEAEGLLDVNYGRIIGDDWDEAGVFVTAPDKAEKVVQYKRAFSNAASLLRVNDPVAAALGTGLNRFGNFLENMGAKGSMLESLGTAAKDYSKGGINPVGFLQGLYTRMIISGRPIRQAVIQRSTTVLQNIYRPRQLLTGMRGQGDLSKTMEYMDDFLATGDVQAAKLRDASAEALGKTLGMSGNDALRMVEHWRDLGGYDAVSSHLYTLQHKALTAKFGNIWQKMDGAVKRGDDVLFGIPGRLGFESGELFTQRTAFLIEAATAVTKGTAKPTSKAWVAETMAAVADLTGNMRSEFRLTPAKGALTLASQFITYPFRMAMVGLPAIVGGSTRLSIPQKLGLVFGQTALFGSSGYALWQATDKAVDWWKENEATPEQLKTWNSMPEALKDGILGETALNSMLSAAVGEDLDFDFSASLAPMGGMPFIMDLAMSVGDSSLTDLFINTKLLKSTGIAEALVIGNHTFNTIFDGNQDGNELEMLPPAAMEFFGTFVPTLDQAWLTYIAYSQDSMLTKSGSPTGEVFSTTKAILTNMMGIQNATDEQAYATLRKANQLMYGTDAKKQELAQSRASLVYKLLQSKLAMSPNKASSDALYYEVFASPKYLIGLLPYDERMLLRQELLALHKRMLDRKPLAEGAVDSLGKALLSPTLSGENARSGYAYLLSRYPQLDENPDYWPVIRDVEQHLTNIEIQNEE